MTPPPPDPYGTGPAGLFAPPPPPGAVTSPDEQTWAMLCHLAALVQLAGVPTFVGPLVVWLIKKDSMPFVDDQGKEAVNFHLTAFIAAIAVLPTACLGIGIPLMVAIAVAAVVLSVVAGVKANAGVYYRYPFTLRLIK
jgi:uncharacterized Tic20 family protein